MQTKKISPLEILQKQKNDLQVKSDELSGKIESNVNYLQKNFVPLLRDNVVESAISKTPHKLIPGIVTGIASMVPLFVKGRKGVILSFVLKQIVKLTLS